MKKHTRFIVLLILLICGATMGFAQLSGKKVSIDPGHGGTDPGAQGPQAPHEATQALSAGLELRNRLQAAGCTVTMTRTTDTYISLTARRDHFNANNPNAALSIHLNAYNTTAGGTETWYNYNTGLANKIQPAMVEQLGLTNRGVKQNAWTVITCSSTIPACLSEAAFVDNPTEWALLTSVEGFKKWVNGLEYGIYDFLGITRPSSCTPPATSEFVLDNTNAVTTGTWVSSTTTPGYIGTDYYHDNNVNKGSSTITYTPNISQRGKYEIFIYYSAGANRPTNTPVDIYSEEGTTRVYVNQQINNNTYVSLGTYNLSVGSNNKVVIGNTGTDGYYVIADAVKFSFVDCLPYVETPVANFTPTSSTVCAGNNVAFTSTSTGATSYSWTFSGGTPSTSTSQNPTVTYNTAGSYNVSLTVTNAGGTDTKTVSSCVTVQSTSVPTADFSISDTEIVAGQTISLTNSSSNATSYNWTIQDGSPSTSTSVSPTVSFTSAGTKTITLKANNQCNSATVTKTVCVGTNVTTLLDNFESGVGHFDKAPTYSGSTVGIATTSTAAQATDAYQSGAASLKVILKDNTSITTDWKVRLLSGGGSAANNTAFRGSEGYFGLWMKTSTAATGATVTAWIDDTDGTEQLPRQTVINDGAWHYYEWFLPTAQGVTITTGNGLVTGTSVTLDAIYIESPDRSTDWTIWIDDIGHKYIDGCTGGLKVKGESTFIKESLEENSDNDIQIYPNPSSGRFTLNCSAFADENPVIRVVNLSGQILVTKSLYDNQNQIDISNFANGIYLIKIDTDKRTITKKIILHK